MLAPQRMAETIATAFAESRIAGSPFNSSMNLFSASHNPCRETPHTGTAIMPGQPGCQSPMATRRFEAEDLAKCRLQREGRIAEKLSEGLNRNSFIGVRCRQAVGQGRRRATA